MAASGSADFQFRYHLISTDLFVTPQGTGDYGLTALVDLDKDGDLDFVLGGRQVKPSTLYWFEYKSADTWVKHTVGTDYQSDVGLAPLDVDGDGWIDLVCSGVWYRNTGKPATEPFERIVFADHAAGAHDILVADVNGDGRKDVVMMGDKNTALNALTWFEIPANPRSSRGSVTTSDLPSTAPSRPTGRSTSMGTAISTSCARTRGSRTPMAKASRGRRIRTSRSAASGPYGMCVRTAVTDLDGDHTSRHRRRRCRHCRFARHDREK